MNSTLVHAVTQMKKKINVGIKNNIRFQSLNFLINLSSLNEIQKSTVKEMLRLDKVMYNAKQCCHSRQVPTMAEHLEK